MKRTRLVFLAVLLSVLFSHPVWAFVVNESNRDVLIKVVKEDGMEAQFVLYPGESRDLPDQAVQVRVLALSQRRGDEKIKVTIIEADGTKHGAAGASHRYGQATLLRVPDLPAEARVRIGGREVEADLDRDRGLSSL